MYSGSLWSCCCFAMDSANESRPEKDTSMPFTVYGICTNFSPPFASCSMLYPGLGSLLMLSTRAKRSSMLPTAMSIVSPKMR